MNDDHRTSISRRNFVRIATGSLVSLPAVAGGFLIPLDPPEAFAEENAANDENTPTAHLVVVKPYQVGIVVEDVSTSPRTLLEGANITLTSRYNNKSLSGTTDAYGTYVFDVTDLSEDIGITPGKPVFDFNGSIEITAKGYRDVSIPLIRVEGGTGLEAPTRPLEQGVPYPRSVALDEWDVLYTADDFLSSTDNGYNIDHEFKVELLNVPDGNVDVSLAEKDAQTALKTESGTAASGTVTVTLKDKFLWISDSNKVCLKKDTSYEVRYTVTGSSQTYMVPLQLTISKADADSPNPTVSDDLKLAPFNDLKSFETGMHFPKDIPLIGGDAMVPWVPTWPANVYFDPFGYLAIAYTSPTWGYKQDNGSNDPDGWKKFPRKTAGQQFTRWSNEIQDRIDGVSDNATLKPKIQQVQCISVFSFGVSFSIMAAAAYTYGNASERQWRGNASASATLSADYSLTETFTVGCVPILLQFGIHAALTIGAGLGFVSPKAFSFDDYRWDYTSTGLTIRIVIAPSLSVGVGIKGVCSVSLRGAFSLTVFIGVNPLPKDHGDNIKNPHVIVGISATLSVVIQLLFYTKTIEITGYEEPNLYNNWQPSSLAQGIGVNGPASFSDLVNDMTIVPASALEARAEFTSTGFSGRRGGTYATPTAFLQATETPLTTNGNVTYMAKVYRRVTLEQAHTLLGHTSNDHSLFAGKSTKDEQKSLLKTWKDQGLIPIWETSGLEANALPELHLIGREYVHMRPEFAVGGLGALGGMFITSDIKIAPNVLSDSRSKIVSLWNTPYVLRLASVMVSGEARSRIVAQQINQDGTTTGKIYLLSFDAGAGVAPRDELFDYDFDVVGIEETGADGKKRHDLHLLVFSGIRDYGDKTSFVSASLDHLMSYVRWSFTDDNDMDQQSVACVGMDPTEIHAAVDNDDDWSHMYCCPQVNLIEDNGNKAVVLSYLERAGTTPDNVFGDSDANNTRVGMGMFFANTGWDFGNPTTVDLSSLRDLIGQFDDLTISEMTCSDRPSGGYHTIMLRGSKQTHYLIVKTQAGLATVTADAVGAGAIESESTESVEAESVTDGSEVVETTSTTTTDLETVVPLVVETESDPDSAVDPDAVTDLEPEDEPTIGAESEPEPQNAVIESADVTLTTAGITDIRRVPDDVFAGDNKRIELIAVPNDSYFLTAAVPSGGGDSRLMRAEWNVGGESVSLGLTECGPTGFNISKFCVHPSGKFIYWPALRDGNAPFDYDKDGNSSQGKENTYNLMGCRLRNNKFSDPFVMAQVDHPMDTMVVLEDESDGMAMVSTHVVDATTAEGDVYFTVVQHAVCASVASAETVMPVAAPKDKVSFYVAIRNDGNTYLSGLNISVEGMGSQRLDFSESTIVESSYNPKGDDGKLMYVEDDYALAPGKTSLYEVGGYVVPEDWHDKYDLAVTIDSGSPTPTPDSVSTNGEVFAEAVNEPYRYEPNHEEMTQDMADGSTVLAGQAKLRVLNPNQVAQGDLHDAPVSMKNSNGNDDGIDDDKSADSVYKKATLPNTGDSSNGLGALATALGLAGAALLAYSKRRCDLEREDDEAYDA